MSETPELLSYSEQSNPGIELPSLNYCNDDSIDRKIAYYYENRAFTDVDFHVLCGESYIPFSCHKLVLSLWSSYFAKKFYEEEYDSGHAVVELSDVLPSTFEVLVEYCYGSNTKLKQNRSDIRFLLKVFKAAKMYQITSLQMLCIEMFSCTVPNKHNVFELLDAASLMGSESLKLRCYKVLQTQTKHILNLESIPISRSVIDMILDMPSLSLDSEYDLISWLFEWASSQFTPMQSEEKDKQEFIQPFLPRLNFLSLTPEKFGKLVLQQKSFFDEKIGFAIFMNIVSPGSWPLPPWCKSTQDFSRSYTSQTSSEFNDQHF